ncbi:hypothetical protein [Sphingobacterium hungaricum]|uniref:Uncharacterized protein n=1 Tax=Sphingobacterium hungaricum TaxID=2082723 RepID=A0A928YQ21_9SPHI|nr:hypothetical protein [Sphingobacterium hungaricum]MBE8712530.1 hypothetical protein [Sphingobacterium hungaricum]
MDNIWIPIITASFTVIANAIFYSFVKNDIDKKIEQHKIIYSGIFKEKLEIYKKLLNSIDELKDKIVHYGHGGDSSGINPMEIRKDINTFIRFNQQASIFYPKNILENTNLIRKELQDVYDLSFQRDFHKKNDFEFKDFNIYFERLSNLTSGRSFNQLKNDLIDNIKMDFNIKN